MPVSGFNISTWRDRQKNNNETKVSDEGIFRAKFNAVFWFWLVRQIPEYSLFEDELFLYFSWTNGELVWHLVIWNTLKIRVYSKTWPASENLKTMLNSAWKILSELPTCVPLFCKKFSIVV